MNDHKNQPKRTLKNWMLTKLPGMITCKDFEQFIVDYIDGNLTNKQRRLFEFHIKICRECKDYLDRYQLTKTLYTKNFQTKTEIREEEVPEDLIAAIIKASANDKKNS